MSSPGSAAACGSRTTGRKFIIATLIGTALWKVQTVIPGRPGKNELIRILLKDPIDDSTELCLEEAFDLGFLSLYPDNSRFLTTSAAAACPSSYC